MKKRIISMALCLALLLGCVLSMSSCLYALGDLVDISINGKPLGESEQRPADNNGGNTGGDSQSSAEDGSGNGAGGAIQFYPTIDGSDMPIESVSASTAALLSAVTVTSHFKKYSAGDFGYSDSSDIKDYSSEGSGVIYKLDREKGDAYIITNFHVVYEKNSITEGCIAESIELYLYGQESETYAIPATYVGGSMTNDIAVLKVENSEVLRKSYALAVSLGDSDSVAVMDSVVAIGNPEALGMAVTSGIVSVDSETLIMTGADGRTSISPRVMRISAAINEGNSGGGLFDASGKLIGIVNAKKTGSEIDNIAYAIPVNVAVGIAENIIHYCDGKDTTAFYKCMLGIQLTSKVMGLVIDEESGKAIKAELVEVDSLTETCITGDALATGDIITSVTVDGVTKQVTRIHHVIDHMLTARVGSSVTLNVTRGDQTFDVQITVPESALTLIK